jgi:hypothetical protein
MESDTQAQDAPKTSTSSGTSPAASKSADMVTFDRYAHDFKARKQVPLAEALRASMGIKRNETATTLFKRSDLDAALSKMLGEDK